MKTFTYVAAIALLTAGTAFAQAQSSTNGAAGANDSTINNSTPTPAAKGAAEGAPRTSTGTSSGMMMNHSGSSMSGSMDKSGSMGSGGSMDNSSSMNMNQSSDMDHAKSSTHAATQSTRTHDVASARSSGNDARENQETERLNRQQLAGAGSAMGPSGSMGYSRGMSSSSMGSSNPANPFDTSSPQQAQAGGANCTPDHPSCGTARENPAINSAPQQRTYGDEHH